MNSDHKFARHGSTKFARKNTPKVKPNGYRQALIKLSHDKNRKVTVSRVPITDGFTHCAHCPREFDKDRYYYEGEWICGPCIRGLNIN